MAREVIKDLVRGDAARTELKLVREALSASQEQGELYRGNIQELQDINANLELASAEYQKVIDAQDKALKDNDRALSKANRQTLFYKITTVAALLGAGYLLIQ